MATPEDVSRPSRIRQIGSALAGIGTGTAIYSTEVYIGYAVAETLKAGFQSPEATSSTVSVLLLLGIGVTGLLDLSINRGAGLQEVALSGIRAGLAVRQAILNPEL